MISGKIFTAQNDQSFVLKLSGDVRLTLATTLENCIEKFMQDESVKEFIIDLHETEGMDSTTLGLIAKVGLYAKKRLRTSPLVLCENQDIIRVIRSMGLTDNLFVVVPTEPEHIDSWCEMSPLQCGEPELKDRIIRAHKTLMSLNESNQNTFKELITALENN